jgi:hypothetical protein
MFIQLLVPYKKVTLELMYVCPSSCTSTHVVPQFRNYLIVSSKWMPSTTLTVALFATVTGISDSGKDVLVIYFMSHHKALHLIGPNPAQVLTH